MLLEPTELPAVRTVERLGVAAEPVKAVVWIVPSLNSNGILVPTNRRALYTETSVLLILSVVVG